MTKLKDKSSEKTAAMAVETVPVDSLHLDPANVRKHDERNIDSIRASLSRFGQQHPIIVSTEGVVIAGNGRLQAMRSLGWKECRVVRTDLKGPEAVAFAIADNRTAELAEWDDDALAQTLAALQNDESIDHLAAGFTDDEIQKIIDESLGSPEVVEDEIPEPPADPITKPGDLWRLGEHRLLCGDSTKNEDWSRLGIPANTLCFTSPPYNLGAAASLGHNKALGKNAYDQFDDNQTPAAWRDMCDQMLTNAMEHCEAAVFNVQPLANNRRDIMLWIAERDEFRDIATWDKGTAAPQISPGVMTSRFEWMVVFGRGKSTRRIPLSSWQGTVSNVYAAPGQRNNEYAKQHGATFPVHLPLWVMSELCNKAAAVVDCCMGTGTTLIAAEQLGRKCYGIEISPAYCDVIVERWEKLTGKKAERDAQ